MHTLITPARHRAGSQPLRDYQQRIADRVLTHLQLGARAQITMPCGTGKTRVAIEVASRLCGPGGVVVLACPTLSLVAQSLAVWQRCSPGWAAVAVCSDEGVTDSWTQVGDLPCPVSTSEAELAALLRRAPDDRPLLVVTTHVSADRLGAALCQAGRRADLLVVDEAHRSAGLAAKTAAVLHDASRFPAARRLNMTATPRILRGSGDVLSMDDPAVFGPVVGEYSVAQAIAEGWLDPYQLVVLGIAESEVASVSRRSSLVQGEGAVSTAAVQIAVAKAMARWDLRRVLMFTSRVAAAQTFAEGLPAVIKHLPQDERPPGHVSSVYAAGWMPAARRQACLEVLRDPPHGGRTVLASAQCLREGVDVPAADGVVLAAPSDSVIQIVQSIGRVMRPHPDGRRVSTVIVPVLLLESPHAAAVPAQWDTVWRVVRALCAQDSTLAAELDAGRLHLAQGRPPGELHLPRVQLALPPGLQSLAQRITVRLLHGATSRWWDGYAAALRYYRRTGHLGPVRDELDVDGFAIGAWVNTQIVRHRQGQLAEQYVHLLERLGIEWEPRAAAWETLMGHVRRFHAEHGHLRVPKSLVIEGYPLGQRLANVRHDLSRTDRPDRRAALDAYGMIWEPALYEWWTQWLPLLQRYRAEFGHLDVPQNFDTEDYPRFGQRMSNQRSRKAFLTAEQRAALDAEGMIWCARTFRDRVMLELIGLHHQHYGTLDIPVTATSLDLVAQGLVVPATFEEVLRYGQWLVRRRVMRRKGTLAPWLEDALTQAGINWNPPQGFTVGNTWEQSRKSRKRGSAPEQLGRAEPVLSCPSESFG